MWTVLDSPLGELRIVAQQGRITAIEFPAPSEPPPATIPATPPAIRSTGRAAVRAAGRPLGERADDDPLLAEARRQLAAYFAGELEDFDLPLAPAGSAFQQAVWDQLRGIGYGQTASYGEIARRLGRSNAASRAVGLANGSNPIAIVIPCHRVVGADGKLVGYAGGIHRKQALLRLEQDALF